MTTGQSDKLGIAVSSLEPYCIIVTYTVYEVSMMFAMKNNDL